MIAGVRFVITLIAALLFGAAAVTAWNAATIGETEIPARAGAWFFLGAAVLTVELGMSRMVGQR